MLETYFVKPQTVEHDTALLMIGGGRNDGPAPEAPNPQHVHIAVAGRAPLSLERSRAGGRMLIFGEADLALDADETAELMALAGRTMTEQEIAALYQRTEGWLAGLLLASQASTPVSSPGSTISTTAPRVRSVWMRSGFPPCSPRRCGTSAMT